MKVASVVLAFGCTRAEPVVAQVPAPPGPKLIDAGVTVVADAPPPTPVARSRTDVTSVWPLQTGADVVGVQLAGPFAKLDEVCAILKPTAIECQFPDEPADFEAPQTPMLGLAELRTYHALPQPPPDHTLDQQRRIAIRTAAGWFVTGGIEGMGGGRGSFGWSYDFIDGHAVFRYAHTKASSGKWAGTETFGVLVCKAVASGSVMCTPLVKTGETRYSTKSRQDGAGGVRDAALACDATFAKGALTVRPMAKADPNSHVAYSKAAAATCTTLPYAGTRPVTFK